MLSTRQRLVAAGLFLVSATLSACSGSPAPPPAKSAALPPGNVLWGDMKPVVSVKELMKYMIDPVSDNLFDAAQPLEQLGRLLQAPYRCTATFVVPHQGIHHRRCRTEFLGEDHSVDQSAVGSLAQVRGPWHGPRRQAVPGGRRTSADSQRDGRC